MNTLRSGVVLLIVFFVCLCSFFSAGKDFSALAAESTVHASESHSFVDIPDNSWFANPVKLLKTMGIISGYKDGTFRPEVSVNRAEIAALMERFLKVVILPEEKWKTVKMNLGYTFKIPENSTFDIVDTDKNVGMYIIRGPSMSTWNLDVSESNHFTLEFALENFYRDHATELTEVQDIVINKLPAKKITVFKMAEDTIHNEQTYILMVNDTGTRVLEISGTHTTPAAEKAFKMFYMSFKGM